MKSIGFVDYYISEWHANNYPAWIKQICEETGAEFEVKYAWAERYDSPVYPQNTDEWCEKFGVTRCDTLKDLCEKADFIMILSPSNPEKHLEYAKEVLKYQKNTYIDKTFAPDYKTAKEIAEIAEACGTKFFSSSALRYATELDPLLGSHAIITTGGGSTLDEYIVHQAEMLVKLTDAEPQSVCVQKQGGQSICTVSFADAKKGTMIYANGLPFSVYAEKENGKTVYKSVTSDFFKALIADILRFFDSGELSFPTEQTLRVMKIREATLNSAESGTTVYC